MSIPSVYINLEDDVSKIVTRLKHNTAKQVVLVCPKRCFLFSDAINLRLLKKQTDTLGKEVFILTMDEKGQALAQEAGFGLKFLPKTVGNKALSDIRFKKIAVPSEVHSVALGQKISQHTAAKAKIVKHPEVTVMRQPEPAYSQEEPKVLVTETVFPEQAEIAFAAPKKSRMGKVVGGLVVLSLILIAALVLVVLPKAGVVVYPKTEPVTRDMEISMSPNIKAINPQGLAIPATLVNQTISVNNKFQSQGQSQVGNKATGTVKIYNFTRQPLNLKAATTILTVGSKTYNLVSDVADLKPTVYKDAKTKEVDPASLGDSVQVIATLGGQDYNLPAGSRMEITNQVFGSRPQILYAVTDSEISGGTTRYLSVISQDDWAKAKIALETQILTQVRASLQTQGLVLADKAYTLTDGPFTTDNPVGAQAPSFSGTLQAQVTGLAFKQDDLSSLISQRIGQTLATNKTLEAGPSSQTSYQTKNIDLVNQLGVLEVHFQGQAVFAIDLPDIAPQLVGKSKDQVNEILRSKADIDKVEITLAPAWQKNFPFFASKINVSIAPQN